jgi:hypothetical protein
MELQDRIQMLLDYSSLNIPKFANLVGFKTPQAVRELLNGRTKTLSDAAKMKLLVAFPQVDETWLMTGEGEMLRAGYTQNVTESENFTQTGNVTVHGDSAALLKVLDELSAQRKLTEKAQEQIDRLISIIEKH